MSTRRNVVAIVGNPAAPSRTKALVEFIAAALGDALPVDLEVLEIASLAAHIGAATRRDALGAVGAAAIESIENADLIIAASPVYKGSYTGLFKHLLDFVDPEALVGRPVLLAATGGSDRHALVVDQQLRPLFSFFRALTVPSAVYAAHADFDGYAVSSDALKARVREAVGQAARLLERPEASQSGRPPPLRAVA